MPGFLETTIFQGYGYLEQTGYVEKARPYVEKARSAAFAVPLVERAATKAEQIVPQLLTRADELVEPSIVRVRPYVEPRIEQVKETVTPYVNKGVERYGVLREESVKYYNTGLEKVEQIKEFKDAKTSQIKDFKDASTSRVREFTDPKVEKIREFTDPQVEKIREFAEPKVNRVSAAYTARKTEAQKLLRVPKSTDLQCLKYETLLGKVASGFLNVEALVDKYLPLPEEQRDSDSDTSTASDSSYTKINKSVNGIRHRLFFAFMIKVTLLLSLPSVLKASYTDGSLKAKVVKSVNDAKGTVKSKAEDAKGYAKKYLVALKEFCVSLKTQGPKVVFLKAKIAVEPHLKTHLKKVSDKLAPAIEKVAPIVTTVTQNSLFKKALQTAVSISEKTLGKEKTATIVSKVEAFIPSVWLVVATKKSKAM